PPIAVKIKIPRIASGTSKIIFVSLVISVSLSFMLCSSLLRKLVVNRLQSSTQMKYRVALAREQRVDVDARGCRQLFEAAPSDFVRDEYFTLLVWQFVERKLDRKSVV